jgi:putative ABC transport system permease protein
VPILVSYSFRNIFKRRLTSALTITGMALVVFVFAAVLMMSHGLETTLVDTGMDDNVTIIMKSSETEIQSVMPIDMGTVARSDAAIARDIDGTPLAACEIMVLSNEQKRSGGVSNIAIRGISPVSLKVRPEIAIVEGRTFTMGTSEVIVGRKTARDFEGCGLGESIRLASREWQVVGVFEAGNSGFESEVWGDYGQFSDAFRRPIYSSITARLANPNDFDAMKERFENDPRLTVDIFREKEYYRRQSEFTVTFIDILGLVISIIFSFGAVIGAMITMYASVSNRTREIGTLRALGFGRPAVLGTFLIESVMISGLAGVLGLAGAYFLRFMEVSTTNWDTFAELAFGFEISWMIALYAMIFAIVMGVVGGFLPAVRASRLKIISALREK